eukprot:Gb_20762 [translate_table: standard]
MTAHNQKICLELRSSFTNEFLWIAHHHLHMYIHISFPAYVSCMLHDNLSNALLVCFNCFCECRDLNIRRSTEGYCSWV